MLTRLTTFPNISMIFLMAVVFSAVTFGIWPAVYASVLSFFAYNLFFIEPLYTFTVARPHELLALVIFLAISVVTSTMAGRIREQAQLAVQRMRAARRLYEFSRRLSGVASYDDIPEAAVAEIHTSLGRPAVVLLAVDGELELRAAWPPEEALDTASMTAARWAIEHDEPAGADTATLPAVPWLFLPLKTGRAAFGVVGLGRDESGAVLDAEARTLLDTFAEQTAAALDRASLAREMVAARSATETERVRNTLLASISHDFRTPLASILGSATSLIDYGDKLGDQDRKNMLADIRDESEGLDQMVRNLLAMTRIDAGALDVRRDWVDVREIVERVVGAARRRGAEHSMEVRLPPDLPMIRADAKLIEQALGNVVGNAITHTPPDTRIVVDGEATPTAVLAACHRRWSGDRSRNAAACIREVRPRAQRRWRGCRRRREHRPRARHRQRHTCRRTAGPSRRRAPSAKGRGTRVTLRFPREEPSP